MKETTEVKLIFRTFLLTMQSREFYESLSMYFLVLCSSGSILAYHYRNIGGHQTPTTGQWPTALKVHTYVEVHRCLSSNLSSCLLQHVNYSNLI